jgi:uncharacterized protein YndB with AHSA1/START domain
MVAKGGAVRVVREVLLPAPADEVWEALTDADRLEDWFANDVELDLERGEGVFRWGDGEERRAVVADSDPNRRLALRWWDPEEVGWEAEVVFTLEEVAEGTRLVVTESQTGPQACAGEWSWALALHVHGRSLLRTL